MATFGDRLRARARELGLSDAEVARRADLSERRYANYAASAREPDFATLLKICEVLNTSPNYVLGVDKSATAKASKSDTKRSKALDRLTASAQAMSDDDLALTVDLANTVIKARR